MNEDYLLVLNLLPPYSLKLLMEQDEWVFSNRMNGGNIKGIFRRGYCQILLLGRNANSAPHFSCDWNSDSSFADYTIFPEDVNAALFRKTKLSAV